MNAPTSTLAPLLLAIALVAALAGGGLAQAGQPGQPAQAGQQDLLKDWAACKAAARRKVLELLRRTASLPQNGSVSFKAVVRANPGAPDAFDVVIESLNVSPAPVHPGAGKAQEENVDAALAPRDLSELVEIRSLPVGEPRRINDELIIFDGHVAP